MKQHITTDQFNELSQGAKEKLYTSLFPEIMKDENRTVIGFRRVVDINPAYLTIGILIEFLSKHTNGTSKMLDNEYRSAGMYASRFVIGTSKSGVFIAYNNGELCDALWGAVKEILESDNEMS